MGVSYDEVTELLETEGVDKFIVSWNELVESVDVALKASK
jgi:transaldolase